MQLLSYVAIFGALQGVLLLLFIALRQRHPGNTPLALFLMVFSLRLATIPTWNLAVLSAHPWLYPLTSPLPFLFGPLLWWFAWSSGKKMQVKPKLLFLHFLPWLAETLAIMGSVYTVPEGDFYQLMNSIFTGQPPLWLTVRNILKVVSNITYLFLTGRIAFGKRSSQLPGVRRVWLRTLTVIPGFVLVFFAYVAVHPDASRQLAGGTATAFLILSTTMAVLIYSVSFLLLLTLDRAGKNIVQDESDMVPLCAEQECNRLVSLLERKFSEGVFRDPDLTLADLSTQLKVKNNRLSYAINSTLGTTFRTVLNSRRLDFFIRRIRLGDLKRFSILDIAFDAGFSSKSTFNRVFKDVYGITPTEFSENPDLVMEK